MAFGIFFWPATAKRASLDHLLLGSYKASRLLLRLRIAAARTAVHLHSALSARGAHHLRCASRASASRKGTARAWFLLPLRPRRRGRGGGSASASASPAASLARELLRPGLPRHENHSMSCCGIARHSKPCCAMVVLRRTWYEHHGISSDGIARHSKPCAMARKTGLKLDALALARTGLRRVPLLGARHQHGRSIHF